MNRELAAYLERLQQLAEEDMRTALAELPGIGPKRAAQLADEVAHVDTERIRASGLLSQGSRITEIVPRVLQEIVMPLAKGETDEPVTSDTKRLIRLPGSLHGKTGLKVVVLQRDELEAFDPLTDAVAFGDEMVRIMPKKPMSVTLRGATFDLRPGEPVSVPEPVAVMAVARGTALPLG